MLQAEDLHRLSKEIMSKPHSQTTVWNAPVVYDMNLVAKFDKEFQPPLTVQAAIAAYKAHAENGSCIMDVFWLFRIAMLLNASAYEQSQWESCIISCLGKERWRTHKKGWSHLQHCWKSTYHGKLTQPSHLLVSTRAKKSGKAKCDCKVSLHCQVWANADSNLLAPRYSKCYNAFLHLILPACAWFCKVSPIADKQIDSHTRSLIRNYWIKLLLWPFLSGKSVL